MTPDFDRAARLAYKTLLSLHVESLPVDPLMILSFCKNTCVRTYAEVTPYFGISDPGHFRWYVAENKDALTVRREINGTAVYELIYDSQVRPARRRFTLAHELGHIVLKHRMEEPWEEKEADYYASQLLAPHPLVALLPPDPVQIADRFRLSRKAAEMALLPPFHTPDPEMDALILKSFHLFGMTA